ncbi:MAG: SurA N-terminal domain-containing protein, partial [Nitrospinota bacterium]
MQNSKLRNKFLQFFFVLAVILLIGCNGGAFWLTGDRYVARVNEDTITEHDFRKRLEGFHTVKDIGEKMKIDIASVDYYKILNDMIDDRLIVQEAIKMDFDRTPEFTGDYNLFKL